MAEKAAVQEEKDFYNATLFKKSGEGSGGSTPLPANAVRRENHPLYNETYIPAVKPNPPKVCLDHW